MTRRSIPDEGGFDRKHAAVELINFLRPTVAVARFIAFAVLAMHAHPACRARIAKGSWVLLDLYGTDMHPAIRGDPEVFRPERFLRRESSGFDLIPQGGGDHYAGHRCPGEAATVELVKSAAKLFATGIDYAVPPQDLSIDMGRIPTPPASGMLIEKVRYQP